MIPNAKVEVFEDSGHVIFMDDTDRFNSLLDRFARGAFERRHTPAG
jgi:pimeloyl-ACP methyl ester carboxylesterase